MKQLILILTVMFCCQASDAKDYGHVTVVTAKGDTIEGFTEPLIKNERKSFKVSPLPDGKKAVKYSANDVAEVLYLSVDGVPEVWRPKNLDGKTLLMRKVKDSRHCILWKVPVKMKLPPSPISPFAAPHQFLFYNYVISFNPDMPLGDAWYDTDLAKGRCKRLPGFKDFVKQYKEEHPDKKIDVDNIDNLLELCDAYAEQSLQAH